MTYPRQYTFDGSQLDSSCKPVKPAKAGKSTGSAGGGTVLTGEDVDTLMKHLTSLKILIRFTVPVIQDSETRTLLKMEEALLDDFVKSKGWVK